MSNIYFSDWQGNIVNVLEHRAAGYSWRDLNSYRKLGDDRWCRRFRSIYGHSVLERRAGEVEALKLKTGEAKLFRYGS